jgi:PAS domain-containing protein
MTSVEFSPILFPRPTTSADFRARWERLLAMISGCAYRRRHDADWTMEFMSERCRDITGYDPHRFVGNASLRFARLIAPADLERANAAIAFAIAQRRPVTVCYRFNAAFARLVRIEDRLTPVFDEAGRLMSIEGVFDLVPTASLRRRPGMRLRRSLLQFLRPLPPTAQTHTS